ncbi:MAG TPA: hypothetical protein VND97_00395 [Beijerinckiaceae bacterium]|nr:hypothetical protein [Beijerinckiaceae bacterium]
MRSLFVDPIQILNAMPIDHLDAPAQKRLRDAAAALSARWDSEPTESLYNLLRSIIVRVRVHADRIGLEIDPTRLAKCLMDDGRDNDGRHSHDFGDASEGPIATLTIPAQLKRAGMEMKFVVDGASNPDPADASLIRLFVRAQKIGKRLLQPGNPPLEEIANAENIGASYATRLVRLTFLAPDIVAAILAGKQPAGLTANKLMADTRLPLDWRDQRTALGFA